MKEILSKPNEWQYIDEESNLLHCWYTKNFLDVLKTFDLSNKKVLELGGGASTLWWANKCNSLISVEDNEEWYNIVLEGLKEKSLLSNTKFTKANNLEDYTKFLLNGETFDVIIVDGSYRLECMKLISESNLNNNGIVILDNFEYMPEVMELPLFRTNTLHVYPEPNHFMWRTAYWEINNFKILTDNHELNSYNQKVNRKMI
jgi:predicted O-methyltransferase YrrM